MSDDKYAENLVYLAKECPGVLAPTLCAGAAAPRGKAIHDRLVDLYVELCKGQPPSKLCRSASNLLAKLVRRDGLCCLVVNLLPQSDGYTLAFKGKNGAEGETIKLPYEESEFLEYLDNEELPPTIADLLEKSPSNLFHSGCVICEVRDYRRNVDANHQSRYVLLQPTNQSLLADINGLTSDGRRWLAEDRLLLESRLLLATERPLCLDPSPVVCLAHNRMQFERRALHGLPVKRAAKRCSQVARNRQKLLATARCPPELRLHDFLAHRRRADLQRSSSGSAAAGVSGSAAALKTGKLVVDLWKQQPVDLAVPKSIDVDKYAKTHDRCRRPSGGGGPARRPSSRSLSVSSSSSVDGLSFDAIGTATATGSEDDNSPAIMEEFTLETERTPGKIHYTRLVLLQRPADETFMGELHVDRDYAEGKERELASCCKFELGSRESVTKYVKQFFEIFTEEGRRQVKITRSRPGQAAKVTYTQQGPGSVTPWLVLPPDEGSGDSSSQVHGQQQQQQQQQLPTAGACGTYQLHPSLVGAGDGPVLQLPATVASAQPLRLSLSIGGSAGVPANSVPSNVLLSGRQLQQQQQQQLLLQQSTQRVRQQLMLGNSGQQASTMTVVSCAASAMPGSGLALIVASAQQGNQLSGSQAAAAQLAVQPQGVAPQAVGTVVSGQGGGSAVSAGSSLLLTPSSSGGLPQQLQLQQVHQLPATMITALPPAAGIGQQQPSAYMQQQSTASVGGGVTSIMPSVTSQSGILSLSASQNFTHVLSAVKGGVTLQRPPTLVSAIASSSQPSVVQQFGGGARVQTATGGPGGVAGMVTVGGGGIRPVQQLPPPSPQLLEALQSNRTLIATSVAPSGQQQQALLVTAMTSQAASSMTGLHVTRTSISAGGLTAQQSQQLTTQHLRQPVTTFQQSRVPEEMTVYQRSPQGVQNVQLHVLQQQQQLRMQSQQHQHQQALLVPHAQIRLGQPRLPTTSVVSSTGLAGLQAPSGLPAAPGNSGGKAS